MKLRSLLCSSALLLLAMPAFADGLGTQVTGTLSFAALGAGNYFDPAYGAAAPSFDNFYEGPTVTIDHNVEFFAQGGPYYFVANFTANGLVFENINLFGGELPSVLTFSDPAFTGFTQQFASKGLTSSFSGDTLTINDAGGATEGSARFTYTTASAVTPEPNALLLVGTGLLGVAGMARRRFLA